MSDNKLCLTILALGIEQRTNTARAWRLMTLILSPSSLYR